MSDPLGYRMLGAPEEFEDAPGMLAAKRGDEYGGTVPTPKPEKDTFWTRLSALFAGANDPRLTPQQNATARRNAMATAGIAMMATKGNFGQQLAAGVGAGQQAGENIRGQAQQQARQEELKQLIGGGVVDESMLRKLFAQAIATGDIDMARSLSEVLKGMGGQDGSKVWEDTQVMVDGKPMTALVNKATGEIKLTPYGAVQRAGAQQRLLTTVNPDASLSYQWVTPGQDMTGIVPQSAPSEKERTGAFFMPNAIFSNQQIDEFMGTPSRIQDFVGARSWGEAAPEEYQMLYTAGRVLGDAYLRITSGAAIKEEEVFMFMKTYLPAPGDKPATLAFKKQLRANFMEGLQVLSARVPGQRVRVLGIEGKQIELDDAKLAELRSGAESASDIMKRRLSEGGAR